MLVGIDIYHPPFLIDLNDTADYNVTNTWFVALSERPDANNTINLMDHSGHRRINLLLLSLISTMSRDEILADVVAR